MAWEVDWSRKTRLKGSYAVWARNSDSRQPSAREWHWTDNNTLRKAGIGWLGPNGTGGRFIDSRGYIKMTRGALTDEDIRLADEHNLWMGKHRGVLFEHRLVALKKFGSCPATFVVRHRNGIKGDNRPENLVLGTSAENNADHNTARLMAMYWHNRARAAETELRKWRDWSEDVANEYLRQAA